MRSASRAAPVAVTNPTGNSPLSCARMSAIGVGLGGRRLLRQRQSHLLQRRAPSRRARRRRGSSASARRPPGRAARRTRPGSTPARRPAHRPRRRRSRRAARPAIRPGWCRGSAGCADRVARSTALTGEGTASRSSRRVPDAIAASCSAVVANTRMSTAAPASCSAGIAAHGMPAAGALDAARQFVHVVGPGAQTGRSRSAGDRLGDGLHAPAPASRSWSVVEVLAARHLGAVGALDDERHAQVRAAACRGRTRRSAPAPRCAGEVRAAARPAAVRRPGSIAASTARAVSGAGTKLRRRSFGSDRMSAVTSSSRSAGTCQANSSPPSRASTSTGTCTVTPSSAAPGSKR